MRAAKFVFITGLLLFFVGIMSLLLAIALPWWACKEYDIFGTLWKVNDGLWKACQKTVGPVHGNEKICITHTEPENYLTTTRSLLSFALILMGAGTLAVVVQKWCLKEMILLGFLGSIVVCVAGVLSWIATVHYAEKYVEIPGNHPDDITACWAMALSASSCCFLSGLLFASRKICAA
ncbi:hypothetical protein ACF0H5_011552 [Mactra antiquata]